MEKREIKIQNNLVLLACDKRWPYFIQQLSLLLEMGIAPKALLMEPHRKYISGRLDVYRHILKTFGFRRFFYRLKTDLLDYFETIGVFEKALRGSIL